MRHHEDSADQSTRGHAPSSLIQPDTEQTKILIEVTKHLTTVTTASLVLLVTFREKFIAPGESLTAPSVAFVSLMLAAASAVFGQAYLVEGFLGKVSDRAQKARWAFALAYMSFACGIIAITYIGITRL